MKKYFFSIAVLLVAFITGGIAYPNLTQEVPIHWNIQEADLFVVKSLAIIIVPILMMLLLGTIILSKKIKSTESTNKMTFNVLNGMMIVLLMLHGFILAQGLQFELNSNLVTGVIVGITIILLANPMQKTKPNAVYGLRTPWTLRNETVWKKSNRFAAKLLMLVGVIILGLSFVVPNHMPSIILILLLFSLLIAVITSYKFSRNLHH
ncbi:SdpI family protein [Solibacillus sp. CAU 1738]|uniref:SdpI family protein n=1 Tax=Solibacillus sp. CAU 1738 TaxID=3140363 RepID=UPI0032611FAC